ncbi:MAG: hypothetical protein Q8937_17145 [Bacteroidota bacterium]|nr:hypothetical protein [Bacteroidota bacterium]
MRKKIFAGILFLACIAAKPDLPGGDSLINPPLTGRDVIHQTYLRYAGKWYRSFVFNQNTEFYRNDSLKGTQVWYEAIKYPALFRIDFGDKDSGNAVIYKGDSSYGFRNGKLRGARKDDNDLTFLLGGMYFYTEGRVMQQLKAWNYDLDKAHEEVFEGKPVLVVGTAIKGDTGVNQLWFDKQDLYLVRLIKFDGGRREDGIFEGQKKFGGGWAETKCRFYFNDKLIQIENYFDCKQDVPLDDAFFEPAVFLKRQ